VRRSARRAAPETRHLELQNAMVASRLEANKAELEAWQATTEARRAEARHWQARELGWCHQCGTHIRPPGATPDDRRG
jgi:hypothetical protein